MKFLDFLNTNSGAFATLFSIIVAVSTAVYAFLTWKLVTETRKMREAQTEPKISVMFQSKEERISLIDLVIRNIGLGSAYGIKFEIIPDFEYRKGKFLSDLNFMKGIKYLAPNQKMQFFLTLLSENFEDKMKTSFNIKVTYNNKTGKSYKETFIIDFSKLADLSQIGEPPLYKISKNIEIIQQEIKKVSTGFHKLKTIVYTKKEIDDEYKQFTKRTNSQKVSKKEKEKKN